jgi:hypothetical protein
MSCLENYATLRIFSADLHPDRISEILGVPATESTPRDLDSKYRPRREGHLWRWSSRGSVDSKDNLDHLSSITALLSSRQGPLDELRSLGCEVDISNYWVSSGDGGPRLDHTALGALSKLGLSIWWDIYFGEASEYGTELDPGIVA